MTGSSKEWISGAQTYRAQDAGDVLEFSQNHRVWGRLR